MQAAIIQFKPQKGAVTDNYNQLRPLCEDSIAKGAKLLHLPEMCLTGYLWPNRKKIEPLLENKKGETFQRFSRLCRERQIYLAYGYPEVSQTGHYYNSQNLIGPEGQLLAHYRKRHLFPADMTWAEPGNLPFQSVPTPLGRLGLGVCMDLNFDDFILFHVQAQTNLLLLAMNWLDEGGPVMEYWRYRLYPFAQTCLIANSHGQDQHILFCGRSAVINHNKILAHLPAEGNQTLLLEI